LTALATVGVQKTFQTNREQRERTEKVNKEALLIALLIERWVEWANTYYVPTLTQIHLDGQ